jgi:hypothetical protein
MNRLTGTQIPATYRNSSVDFKYAMIIITVFSSIHFIFISKR